MLWPLGKLRVFQKIKQADVRSAQTASITKNSVFDGRDINLHLVGKIMQMLVPCNEPYASYLCHSVCPICYTLSKKMSSHSPNHEKSGLWEEMGANERRWGDVRKKNMWANRHFFAGHLAFWQHNAIVTDFWPSIWEKYKRSKSRSKSCK